MEGVTTAKVQVNLALVESLLAASLPYKHCTVNVYLFGSRAHGLATPESDYDVLAVVDSPERDLPGSRLLDFPNYNLSITVVHLPFFAGLIFQNVVWIVAVLYLPREFVWKEDVRVPFALRKVDLRRVVLSDVDQQLERHKWKGDAKRGKKNFMHALRTLHYALQLLREGAITDLHEANHYWHEINDNPSAQFEDYKNTYGPLFQELKSQVIALTEPKPVPELRVQPLTTLCYIEAHGLQALSTELNIVISPDDEHADLFMLHSDNFKCLDHPVVKECSSGLLIEMKGTPQSERTATRVVCYPPHKVYEATQPYAESVDMSMNVDSDVSGRLKVFKMMISDKARLVSLYHYDGHWRICSSESTNCTDRVLQVRVPSSTPDQSSDQHGDEDAALGYLSFRSTTHYNYWEILEETLIKPRRAFANFIARAKCVDPAVEQKNEGGPEKERRTNEKTIHDSKKTLGNYFWEIWNERGYHLPQDTGLCYTFLVSVAAIHTSDHLPSQGQALVCGVRDLKTLDQLVPEAVVAIAQDHGWESVFDHPWKGHSSPTHDQPNCVVYTTRTDESSIDPYPWPPITPTDHFSLSRVLQRESRRLDPRECAGFLIVDNNMHRVKIISPQYTALARLKWFLGDDKALRELLLEVIRANDHPVFLLPEWEPAYRDLHRQFHNLLRRFEEAYYPLLSASREEYVAGEKRYKFRRSLTFMVKSGVGLHGVRDHLCDLPLAKPPPSLPRHAHPPSCLLPLMLAHSQS